MPLNFLEFSLSNSSMACVGKLCHKALLILFILKFILKLLVLINASPQVPCYFIFGDSLVDNGNNNELVTTAKVNYPPYGIDFPDGPTGRFTNGQTSADILGTLLGFDEFIPPFATARGRNILRGMNYGSGGAGIRPETGANLGGRISLDQQLRNHRITVARIAGLQRNISFTKEYLSKCIYTVGMGSNDYINNYLMPQQYPTSTIYTPDQFAAVLIQQYSKQLKTLYKYGAKKVAIFGVGLIGCTPAEIANFGADASGCVDRLNAMVQLFNDRLKPLVDGFNSYLTDAKFIYVNATNISLGDFTGTVVGITVINVPCCNQCAPNEVPCSNRNTYVFWDDIHPTEIVNQGSASRSYTALSPLDTYPVDICTLAQQ